MVRKTKKKNSPADLDSVLPSALGKKSSRVGETTYGGERERTGVNTQHYNMEGRKD